MPLRMLTDAEVVRHFGNPAPYIRADGTVSPRWEAKVVAYAKLPAPLPASWDRKLKITRLKCHYKIAATLQAAMFALHVSPGVWETIGDCGGCFQFRTVSGKKNLSRHSWGVAIDLDVRDNPMFGLIPRVHRATRSIMEDHGFIWGGATIWGGAFPWGRRDGQHWEFADVRLLT